MKWLEQEKKKLTGLSRKAKLEYVWQYYKLWLIGGAALILFGIYFGFHLVNANRDTHLYVGFVNTYADVGNDSNFWKNYVEYSQTDIDEENVIFDKEMYFDMTQGDVRGNHYYEKLVVLIDSKTLDAVVTETENLRSLGANGRLLDLNNERADRFMEKYEDRIITAAVDQEDGTTREVPIGIDISDSILMTEEDAYVGGCAIGISSHAEHLDAVLEFLDYILQE